MEIGEYGAYSVKTVVIMPNIIAILKPLGGNMANFQQKVDRLVKKE